VVSRPRSRKPDQQLPGQGGVLGGALHQGQWVLGPVQVDAEGDHAGGLAEVDPVDHQADQVEGGQVGGQQLGQRRVGHGDNRRETADLLVPDAACSAWVPTGSSPSG
jgi:hypothetical protein